MDTSFGRVVGDLAEAVHEPHLAVLHRRRSQREKAEFEDWVKRLDPYSTTTPKETRNALIFNLSLDMGEQLAQRVSVTQRCQRHLRRI